MRRKRERPALVVSCPDCGATFVAGIMVHLETEDLVEYTKYAEEGYDVRVIDASELEWGKCECAEGQRLLFNE